MFQDRVIVGTPQIILFSVISRKRSARDASTLLAAYSYPRTLAGSGYGLLGCFSFSLDATGLGSSGLDA